MISDATVEIVCDGCEAFKQVKLRFVFAGPMHTAGRYDHSDESVLRTVGWREQSGKHYCDDCPAPEEPAQCCDDI